MRKSSNKTGFTQVDHVTFDVIIPMLSTVAQSIFLRIYRQTRGWGKETDKISGSQFQKFCNIGSRNTVQWAIDELVDLDLIIVEGKETQVKEFGINWEAVDRYLQPLLDGVIDEK